MQRNVVRAVRYFSAVERCAERIDHATEQRITDGDRRCLRTKTNARTGCNTENRSERRRQKIAAAKSEDLERQCTRTRAKLELGADLRGNSRDLDERADDVVNHAFGERAACLSCALDVCGEIDAGLAAAANVHLAISPSASMMWRRCDRCDRRRPACTSDRTFRSAQVAAAVV